MSTFIILRDFRHEIRAACALTGGAMILAGVLTGLGTLLAHLAWALPLADLGTRPGTIIALALIVPGFVLTRAARGTPPGAASPEHPVMSPATPRRAA